MARTTPAEMASVSAIQARAAAEAHARATDAARARSTAAMPPFPTGGDSGTAGTDEPPTTSRLTRTITSTVAAMIVCGVVTAAAVLTGERPHRPGPSIPTVEPVEIVDATVVRPDLMREQLATGLLTVGQRGTAGGLVGALQPGIDPRLEQLAKADATRQVPVAAPSAPTEQIQSFVDAFYKAAQAQPASAFEMLGPQMRGDGIENFVAGWEGLIANVQGTVIVNEQVARAVVVIAWKDATILRSEQLLIISEGPEPKIVGAKLLSAHRA